MRIVIVDDEVYNCDYLARVLYNYDTINFSDPAKALENCLNTHFDILITDQKMPELSGIELVHRIRGEKNDFLAIVISAYTDAEDLIDAVNSNAVYKYLVKPFSPDFLLQSVHRAIEHLQTIREKRFLEIKIKDYNDRLLTENTRLKKGFIDPLDSFVGFHPDILSIKEKASAFARSEQPVLITGETGTGKELLARAIHQLSLRADRNFVTINCSAIPESLLESELFGYVKGAFTGATSDKQGFFQLADKGTLFLDEIGELSPQLQAKLLRVLQFGTFFAVGSVKEEKVNVRIITATNKTSGPSLGEAGFREDLLYRINTFHMHLPPLRNHKEDIMSIFQSIVFKKGFSMPPFTEEAEALFIEYRFPGNVRELENMVEKLYLLSTLYNEENISRRLVEQVLNEDRSMYKNAGFPSGQESDNMYSGGEVNALPDGPLNLENHLGIEEKRVIEHYFRKAGYNISKTAKMLGLSRQGLKNKLLKHGLLTN